jgi:hypothetical protein
VSVRDPWSSPDAVRRGHPIVEILVNAFLASAMLSSPRRPAITMRIFSSAQYCRRVVRRISRTRFFAVKMSSKSALPQSLTSVQLVLTANTATLSGLLPVSRASPRSTCLQLLATAASVAGGVFSLRYISASWRTGDFVEGDQVVRDQRANARPSCS